MFRVSLLLIGCIATCTSDAFLILSLSSPVFVSTLNIMAQNSFETPATLQSRKLKINHQFESSALFRGTLMYTETSGKIHVLTFAEI
jgi:hypothetical protein